MAARAALRAVKSARSPRGKIRPLNARRVRLRRHVTAVEMPVQPPDMLPPPEEDVQPAGVVDDAAHPAVRHRRAIYLLPNAFTTGNLFDGFYAIVMAMNGEFQWAAIAIFLAMFLDSLDGRVARLTNSQSTFGEQYDSLADMISFGAAPALVIYSSR